MHGQNFEKGLFVIQRNDPVTIRKDSYVPHTTNVVFRRNEKVVSDPA